MVSSHAHAGRNRRSARETAAAWLATGPVGHLLAGLADWLEVLARYARARLRGDRW